LQATQKDDYPITVQTGHSVAEIILSPDPIEYTGIDEPAFMIVVSEDGLRRVRRRLETLTDRCTVYAEASLEMPETRAAVKRFPFVSAAKPIGKLSVVTLALATLLQDTGVYPVEAFAMAIKTFQKAKIAEVNLRAVKAGRELADSPTLR
jgi:Pyruvate/2-oxoacid:ferredoxin oxidoreductase gamma subunit